MIKYNPTRTSLFIAIIFVVGGTVGGYYHSFIHALIERIVNITSSHPVHYCPQPNIVKAQQDNSEEFISDELSWQMEFQGWKVPEKIGFMQALFNEDNTLICYYRWPDPKNRGTNLWMTIHLSPPENQIAKPYGSYWKNLTENTQALCTSGIKACGFILSQDQALQH